MVVKLKIEKVSFSYGEIPVCEDINIEVNGGEVVSLLGPNGSGKTTILRCIAKVLKPRLGVIFVDEKNIQEISYKEFAKLLAYLPQKFAVNFPFTAFEVVLMGRKPFIKWQVEEEDLKTVEETLKLVEAENLANRYFDELSGGESQRVMVARVLAQKTHVLLLDEPTANLDVKHQLQLLNLIRKIVKENKMVALISMHNLNLAARFSDKIAMIKNGKIVAFGPPDQVLTSQTIKSVYGIDAKIINLPDLGLYVIPVKPVEPQSTI
ncbi:MAG: ABC transporter ATP-binding protein [Candidatus Bathyarchaeota archaeon]|nr:ABC transporter ATP-binding protein [Candidatus Bathyarchaeota archaeon]